MKERCVDVRTVDGKARLRFYGVAEDQLETIQLALKITRVWAGTQHDSVALDAICQHFLSSGVVDPKF